MNDTCSLCETSNVESTETLNTGDAFISVTILSAKFLETDAIKRF